MSIRKFGNVTPELSLRKFANLAPEIRKCGSANVNLEMSLRKCEYGIDIPPIKSRNI